MRKKLIHVFALTLIANLFSSPAQASTYNLKIYIKITSDYSWIDEDGNEDGVKDDCANGYNDYDIGMGSSLKVVNESGKTIGLGKVTKVSIWRYDYEEDLVAHCGFRGTVKVGNAKFYKILVDGRNGPDYSLAQLKKLKWSVTLTI
jgi:hypothetical protein